MNLQELIVNCTPDNRVELKSRDHDDWRATATLKPIIAAKTWNTDKPVYLEGRGDTPVDALYSLARVLETELWKWDK